MFTNFIEDIRWFQVIFLVIPGDSWYLWISLLMGTTPRSQCWRRGATEAWELVSGDWLVVNLGIFPFFLGESHHPNWRSLIFFRGVPQPPTSQFLLWFMSLWMFMILLAIVNGICKRIQITHLLLYFMDVNGVCKPTDITGGLHIAWVS